MAPSDRWPLARDISGRRRTTPESPLASCVPLLPPPPPSDTPTKASTRGRRGQSAAPVAAATGQHPPTHTSIDASAPSEQHQRIRTAQSCTRVPLPPPGAPQVHISRSGDWYKIAKITDQFLLASKLWVTPAARAGARPCGTRACARRRRECARCRRRVPAAQQGHLATACSRASLLTHRRGGEGGCHQTDSSASLGSAI